MELDNPNIVQNYLNRVALDFDKYADYCVIVAYLCNIQEPDSWTYKFLEKTYFKYLTRKLILEPNFEGNNLWSFAKGYCLCLKDNNITVNDVSILTSEGFKFLSDNDRNIHSIYESIVIDELSNTESNYIYDFCDQIFETINTKIFNENIAYQFMLEELEAASYGNDEALEFVKRNNFLIAEFQGAMADSQPEVDGVNGPQQALTRMIMGLTIDMEIKTRMRIIVVQKVIDCWCSDSEAKADLNSFI